MYTFSEIDYGFVLGSKRLNKLIIIERRQKKVHFYTFLVDSNNNDDNSSTFTLCSSWFSVLLIFSFNFQNKLAI